MTIVISSTIEDAVVMVADRKILQYDDGIEEKLPRAKIISFENENIGIAFWGHATLDCVDIEEHVNEIKRELEENGDEINVDSYAEACKNYFSDYYPDYPMGLHIGGFMDGQPRIRHVFHEAWHDANGFTNENSNLEFHDQDGDRIYHSPNMEYEQFHLLFNGDNKIVRNFINNLPREEGNKYKINIEGLNQEEIIELLITLAGVTIHLQNFMSGYQDTVTTCGRGVDILTIEQDKIMPSYKEEIKIKV